MRHIDFDPSVLRSFVAGIDLGSFAKAAVRVGRSTSAVSAQIGRLEEQTGTVLFRKAGRHLQLTEAGELLLVYARRIIEINDEAAGAVRGIALDGRVRLGMQEDFGETTLPEALGRFARAHPKVRIEAHVARNTDLIERIESNQLDLALVWSGIPEHNGTLTADFIATPSMHWIGSSSLPWSRIDGDAVPLIGFDRPCQFHSAATSALDHAGIPWRMTFTSPSLAGLRAAAAAGLGIMVRTPYGLPSTLALVDKAAGLPPLPAMPLSLFRQSHRVAPAVDRLASIILESVSAAMTSSPATHRAFQRPIDLAL